jgi:NTP pyrophosphatase (non-canonical NTP hydrolase)
MTPNFLNYVRHLSKQDRKSLSQKALKTCEEVGELAKVVLPFDNAYATTHRFTERESILEEAVDTVLCALSVAYDLDFTDEEIEEMMLRKAEKWALLQSKEQNIKYPLPYEIHITVMLEGDQTVAGFRDACASVGVKPIILDLEDRDGNTTMVDVMTSSKHFGDNRSAYTQAQVLAYGLRERGYPAVRTKIETVPWHPAAPVDDQPMPVNCYFESHIPIVLCEDHLDDLRKHVAKLHEPFLHLSRNVYKRNLDGTVVQMLTLRFNFGNYVGFKKHLDAIVNTLRDYWETGKVITEFSIYDTKVSHDATWIKG